ncbi:MAG: hypothetical protein CVT48_04070 [Thermoplasmata archaeon HGW-Thermoplasmata-1]|nr:MAG: hypothetical protein CVT48_04070 [Thermoplasmata archaeon HGW-Thermoplasmata-1]
MNRNAINEKPAAKNCISNLERNEKVHQHFGVNPREYQRYERGRTRKQPEWLDAGVVKQEVE